MQSQGLEKFDQGTLVLVAQTGLLAKEVGAEVMATIDDVVRALADLEQRFDQVRKDLSRLLVGRARRKRFEVALGVDQKAKNFLPLLEIDVGQQVDGRALGNRTDLDPAFTEEPRLGVAQGPDKLLQEIRQISLRNAQIGSDRSDIDNAGRLFPRGRHILSVALSPVGPEQLLDAAVEGLHAVPDGAGPVKVSQ